MVSYRLSIPSQKDIFQVIEASYGSDMQREKLIICWGKQGLEKDSNHEVIMSSNKMDITHTQKLIRVLIMVLIRGSDEKKMVEIGKKVNPMGPTVNPSPSRVRV
jgi:hypothetical protein